jgi:hypothetical protein
MHREPVPNENAVSIIPGKLADVEQGPTPTAGPFGLAKARHSAEGQKRSSRHNPPPSYGARAACFSSLPPSPTGLVRAYLDVVAS